MSTPSIPGFTQSPRQGTLADLWSKPDGDFPEDLWPVDVLRTAAKNPLGWLVIEQHFYTELKHGGVGCVLTEVHQATEALRDTSWAGRQLGVVGIGDDNRFEGGLRANEDDVTFEFFVHARRPSGGAMPVVEVDLQFLWYWDAFPVADGWRYVNIAGREQELLRWRTSEDSWTVEVKALEFRQFLAARGRTAVLQIDHVCMMDALTFERVDDDFRNEWAHVDFYALIESARGDRPAFSRVVGQYLVSGLSSSRVPRFEEYHRIESYPTFIYGREDTTGEPLTHICDPDQLGTTSTRTGLDSTT